jgi:hypothetical protein
MKKFGFIAVVIAAAIAASLAGAPSAHALQAGSVEQVSLPYVDDVNEYGAGRYVLTVTCCGSPKAELRATVKGKRVKVVKRRPRVWTVVVRRGAACKLSVRARGGKWKSIGYRVY